MPKKEATSKLTPTGFSWTVKRGLRAAFLPLWLMGEGPEASNNLSRITHCCNQRQRQTHSPIHSLPITNLPSPSLGLVPRAHPLSKSSWFTRLQTPRLRMTRKAHHKIKWACWRLLKQERERTQTRRCTFIGDKRLQDQADFHLI